MSGPLLEEAAKLLEARVTGLAGRFGLLSNLEWIEPANMSRATARRVLENRRSRCAYQLREALARGRAELLGRPSREWYRARILESLDDEPEVVGGFVDCLVCGEPRTEETRLSSPACPFCMGELAKERA